MRVSERHRRRRVHRDVVAVRRSAPGTVPRTISGDPTGFSADLWNEIARRNEWRTEWVWTDTVEDQIQQVVDRRVDAAIAAISMTPDREQKVDLSHRMFSSGLQIMTRPERASLWEAFRATVPTPDLFRASSWLEGEGIDYEPVADVEAAIERLENGDSDAFVFDSPVLKYARSQRQGAGLEVGGELFDPVPYGIALQPGSPLREQINTSMLDMLTDGTYDRILETYGG